MRYQTHPLLYSRYLAPICGYRIDGNLINISALSEIEKRYKVTRVYNISDLIGDAILLTQARSHASLPRSENADDIEARISIAGEEVIRVIAENVDTSSWKTVGNDLWKPAGPNASATIRLFQLNIIATTTPERHAAIVQLLSQLRSIQNYIILVRSTAKP